MAALGAVLEKRWLEKNLRRQEKRQRRQVGNCGKILYKEIGNWTQPTGPLVQPGGVGVSSGDNRHLET